MAGNSGSGSWAEVRSTEKILQRFVEAEADKEYPDNGHLTQVSKAASGVLECVFHILMPLIHRVQK